MNQHPVGYQSGSLPLSRKGNSQDTSVVCIIFQLVCGNLIHLEPETQDLPESIHKEAPEKSQPLDSNSCSWGFKGSGTPSYVDVNDKTLEFSRI